MKTKKAAEEISETQSWFSEKKTCITYHWQEREGGNIHRQAMRHFPPRSCSLFPFLPKSSWIYFPWENKKQAFISSQQFTSSSLPGIPSPITSIVLLLPRLQLRWFHLLIATCWSSSITRINSLSSSPNEIHRLLLFLPLSPLSS